MYFMDPLHIVLIVGAGILGGIISSIAGGAALFIFPALLATGLSPVVATAVSTAALTPSLLLAALCDRAQLPPLDRSLLAMVVVAIVGGLIGAALLLLTPERMFTVLVPLLLGFATVLFAFADRVSTWRRARAGGVRSTPHALAALLPVSVYGGYFGAGLGVLLLGVLSVGSEGGYRAANATKNLVSSFNSLTAAVIFAVQDVLAWPATLLMIAGTLLGALLGVRLVQVMPNVVARRLVVAVGVLLTAAFAWRYWL
jgi:uncharacterized protein